MKGESNPLDFSLYYVMSVLPDLRAQYRIQRQGKGRGGTEKHEIYAAAFGGHLFMTYFHRARGGMAPSAPPGSATGANYENH